MCGLYANISVAQLDSNNHVESGIIGTLLERGPDAAGVYKDDQLLMVHTLLSLTGVPEKSIQPIFDDRYVFVFNGEIFNYRELANIYLKVSVNDDTSDGQILFKLLRKYGHKIIDKLDGQFAFIYWDKLKQKGLAARDFFGQKPLYYRENTYGIEFASIIKTLHFTDHLRSEINLNQLASIGKNFVCEPGETIYPNIKELHPGTIYQISLSSNVVNLESLRRVWPNYWSENSDIDYSPEEFNKNFQNAVNSIKSNLHKPSIFFSGGLDSTAVASICRVDNDIRLYSLALSGDHSDESQKQQSISKQLGIPINSIDLNTEQYVNELEIAVDNSSTISSRLGFVGINHLCRSVNKDGRRLVYTGEGADEVLYGYDLFYENYLVERIHKLDFDDFSRLYQRVNAFSKESHNEFFEKLAYASFKKRADKKSFQSTKSSRNGISNLLLSLFGLDTSLLENADSTWESYLCSRVGRKRLSRVESAKVSEVYGLLQHLLTIQGDHMSAANSIETRTPFLNKSFVDLCGKIKVNSFFEDWNSEKKFLKNQIDDYFLVKKIGQKFPYRGKDPLSILSYLNLYLKYWGILSGKAL